VLALLDDPALRRRMGEAGRAAAGEFAVERMIAQLETIYEELLSARAAT